MQITPGRLRLPGTSTIGTNPLPVLRDQRVHLRVESNGTLSAAEQEQLGDNTARRVLPYLLQDRYGRQRRLLDLETVELDNGLLRAVFLPGLGGRLYSLTDLTGGRELLFTNPILQPANLAVRDAWFAGGIEWNLGFYGHAVTSCEPLFCGIGRAPDGDFLRIWEYERMRGLFWQVDFRLPDGRPLLEAHVRIVNPSDVSVPLYWWTNIAVPQAEGTRVFSATDQAIHTDTPAQVGWLTGRGLTPTAANLATAPVHMGHTTLPWFTEDGRRFDGSYPLNFSRASEYFFQIPADESSPWEAATQPDGTLFFERSTQPLRFRKMFCWGNHDGGRWWCDFLAEPGRGDYCEVQAGLAPTQLHGCTLDAGSELEFTQVFSGLTIDPALAQGTWQDARQRVLGVIDHLVPADDVVAADTAARRRARLLIEPADLLCRGSDWGALEARRSGLPEGFVFPSDSLGADQAPWLALLTGGVLPEGTATWLVDPRWRPLLQASLERERTASTLVHLGLLEWEDLAPDRAETCWQEAADLGSPLALRTLAAAERARGRRENALRLMTAAWASGADRDDVAYAEEYLALLVDAGHPGRAWQVFGQLPPAARASERVLLQAGRAGVELGQDAFVDDLFERDWAGLREGDNTLIDLWHRRQAGRLAAERGEPVSEALVAETMESLDPPRRIDSRMYRPPRRQP
ncbi:MAG: DUF5107 domain-containing protein [Propionicimonas sp.]|nr:DUF5107 domain-containing protein [Propionicimonas sp.]